MRKEKLFYEEPAIELLNLQLEWTLLGGGSADDGIGNDGQDPNDNY